MKIVPTELPGVVLVESPVYRDDRGYFMEIWNRDRYAPLGLPDRFVQDNISSSGPGVLRGLHYQHPEPQGKLISVLEGSIYDVAVDIRVGSPTFGRWVGVELTAGQGRQVYIPEGFAHGFAVTDGPALVLYQCTNTYNPRFEGSIRWDDPDLAIAWPSDKPVLSPKDQEALPLRRIPEDRLPRYHAPGDVS
jgi:dTDP-4-dehydrorhamnose 3,5-epimerase